MNRWSRNQSPVQIRIKPGSQEARKEGGAIKRIRSIRDIAPPLPLQDLCLLETINDLDSYPVELLSSLPHWLRYRLLNNLPVLDLCRLDHTPIARGVDIDEVWTARVESEPELSRHSESGIECDMACFHQGSISDEPLSKQQFKGRWKSCTNRGTQERDGNGISKRLW